MSENALVVLRDQRGKPTDDSCAGLARRLRITLRPTSVRRRANMCPVGDDILIERVDPLKGERRISRLDAGRKVETVLASAPERELRAASHESGVVAGRPIGGVSRRDRDRQPPRYGQRTAMPPSRCSWMGQAYSGWVRGAATPRRSSMGSTILKQSGTSGDWTFDEQKGHAAAAVSGERDRITTVARPAFASLFLPTNQADRKSTCKGLAPTDGRWQITDTGGSQPNWRGDDRELFLSRYRPAHSRGQHRDIAVPVRSDRHAGVRSAQRRWLFRVGRWQQVPLRAAMRRSPPRARCTCCSTGPPF